MERPWPVSRFNRGPSNKDTMPSNPYTSLPSAAMSAYARGISNVPGMVEPPTMDIMEKDRPAFYNPDGSMSTMSTMSKNVDGKEVLIPTVVNGRRLSDDQAVKYYLATGKHYGKFATPQDANFYAKSIHPKVEGIQNSPQYQATIDRYQATGAHPPNIYTPPEPQPVFGAPVISAPVRSPYPRSY